jgi:phage terminase large subunit-like protein
VPKKNGKSELAAAVALYLTCGDGEWGAEVYGCAADRQQASIVFDVAVDMVEQSPALKKRIKPVLSKKRLVYMPTGSFYQVLSSEAYTKHGFNVHGVVFDELHAQPNRQLYDVMTIGSGDARKQPLFFLITTAGTDRNSICYEVHRKAEDILRGKRVDPTFYPVIYGVEDGDDWGDEKVWYKANPSLGHTIDIGKVRAAHQSAKENPAEENLFRQLRLNQWVKQSVRWMPMETWEKCAHPADTGKLKGRVCYGGLDLSSSIDITAFVLVFPPTSGDDKYYVLPYFWLPEETLDLRVRRDHVPYDIWRQQGYLLTTKGNVIHYGFIEKFIEDLNTQFHIKEIAFDRWGAVQMVQNLEGAGFTVVPFGQGYKDMSPPTKELMKLTLEGKIAHGGHPVLSWMMDNNKSHFQMSLRVFCYFLIPGKFRFPLFTASCSASAAFLYSGSSLSFPLQSIQIQSLLNIDIILPLLKSLPHLSQFFCVKNLSIFHLSLYLHVIHNYSQGFMVAA